MDERKVRERERERREEVRDIPGRRTKYHQKNIPACVIKNSILWRGERGRGGARGAEEGEGEGRERGGGGGGGGGGGEGGGKGERRGGKKIHFYQFFGNWHHLVSKAQAILLGEPSTTTHLKK